VFLRAIAPRNNDHRHRRWFLGDNKAADHYGNIRASLERQGKTIGVNDLHIAGHARSEGLTLVSNNTREFERIDGLMLVDWVKK